MREFTVGTMYWLNPNYGRKEFACDCRRLVENGYTLVRLIVWWELVEEKKGRYDFSFVDDFMAEAEKTPLNVMITVGFYPPFWLTCELDAAGRNDPGRYPSLARDEVRRPLAKLIEALVTRYRNSPALAYWNIWNEPTLNMTKNRPVLEAFAAWLKRKYPTYDDLRQGWRGEYPVLSLLLPESLEALTADWLETAFRLGSRGRTSAIEYDFLLFAPELLADQVRWLCGEIRKYDTSHPTHTNLHGVNGNPVTAGRDFYRTAAIPDTISCSIHQSNDNVFELGLRDRRNFYLCGIDRTWSWRKGGEAMVGELQVGTSDVHPRKYTPTPETITAELWLAYAAGLHGVIHWEFQGWRSGTFELGEFGLRAPADGGPTPRSEAVEQFARTFSQYRDRLLPAERPAAQIAILDSYRSGIYEYLQWIDHRNVPDIGMNCVNAVLGCYRALREANFAVEFVSEEEVVAGILPRYRVLFLPGVPLLSREAGGKIVDFVRQGGQLWADGRCGWLDEHMFVRGEIPGHGLQQVFGAREREYRAESEEVRAVRVDGLSIAGRRMRQDFMPLPGAEAKIYARYSDGTVAAVENRFGRGRARLWGVELSRRLRNVFDPAAEGEISGFAGESGVRPEMELPCGVIGRVMERETSRVAVLNSLLETSLRVPLPPEWRSARHLDGSAVSTELVLGPGATEVLLLSRPHR